MDPLQTMGLKSAAMASGDGVVHCCHPIFAIFVGDYPEQVLVIGVKTGECPMCECPRDKLEDEDDYEYRDLGAILEALTTFDNLDAQVFV